MFDDLATEFAPAARSASNTLETQKMLLSHFCGSLSRLYDAVSEIVLVVNEYRQIVFFNSVVPSLLGVEDPDSIYGLRPGEALGCQNACRNPAGCGTSVFCSQCGAVNAILAALSNQADLRECRIVSNDHGQAFDLLVRTTPIEIEGQAFVIVAISDISHEKRRRALERLFFHDVMNTARSIEILTDLLGADPEPEDAADLRQHLLTGARQLMEALYSQKILLAAENNELSLNMSDVDGCRVVREVVGLFRNRFQSHSIDMELPLDEKATLLSDRSLLARILGNMIQNAVEASRPDQPVRVSCKVHSGDVEFRVYNNGYIAEPVQLQLFQRSFSTKGTGRGLGTYSMKLLGERYLKGRISFESSPLRGTVFTARFPAGLSGQDRRTGTA
jgi:signal transduction histidine kinase